MSIRRSLAVLVAALSVVRAVQAQAIHVTGNVRNAQGQPAAGAAVRLLGAGASGTTGSDGSFSLQGTVSLGRSLPGADARPGLAWSEGRLAFRVASPGTRASLRVGTPDGRLAAPPVVRRLPAGAHAWPLPAEARRPGLHLVTLDIEGVATTFKVAGLEGTRSCGITSLPSASGRERPAAKAAAALDTLEVRFAGHVRKTFPIASANADVQATLSAQLRDPGLSYTAYTPAPGDRILSRSEYLERMHGFWLGQCIGNWTGLVTEMDKIAPPFYTSADWGKRDQRNIWNQFGPHPDTLIDFVLVAKGTPWGADDDTDLEYIYQHLLDVHDTSVLTGKRISDGWQAHIKAQEENFLWVSNERAFHLMRGGMLPPETSLPANNIHYDMIDAQLTTESFGLYAPARPDVAARMAHLPIRTTAYGPAERISQFYVRMHALAPSAPAQLTMKEKVLWLAREARPVLGDTGYPAKMYDYVLGRYTAGNATWEKVRDELHTRYQVGRADGYAVPGRAGVDCQGCFAAGINFAASLVSLLWGEGDIVKTIKIGTLSGWDSDNPTATWAGLLGFMLGKQGVETAFGRTDLSETFHIHRTRQGFPDRTPGIAGEDTFPLMAERAVRIIDRVVLEEMKGGVDPELDVWYVPAAK